ncbi:hypothetical protein KP509_06G041100 [Ceratopteris richardii]|uniref:GDSL esterase/lipase n=1 Tax=Ceratopteris richardii TaxID=49495 RepID=A0A8T2UK66_CERRI|nr:hypothetical protein KP509_06G041100 [Ceratopteris richardii]
MDRVARKTCCGETMLFVIVCTMLSIRLTNAKAGIVASFVFGDSIVDAGNNNFLPRSLATAKGLPNGIDFPTRGAAHPTGRFTNGVTIADLIGRFLGLTSFAPPVLSPSTKGSSLLQGVNYASGGAGILNETGRFFIQIIPMDKQISYFEENVKEIEGLLGVEKTKEFFANSLFSITVGANDFMGNYIFPVRTTVDKDLTPEQYYQKLLGTYKGQIERLYAAGARKLVIANVPLIGCTPYLRSLNLENPGNCSTEANNLAQGFNARLKSLLQQLNEELPGAWLLYADAYGITSEVIYNYESYGFSNAEKACCGLVGKDKGVIPCRLPFMRMCDSRDEYFFWDPYHPSQTACNIIASEFFQGSRFISPFNIRQLASL